MTGTLPELLTRAAGDRPDHPAVVADRTLSYRELDALASRIAGALIRSGVRLGDRVAVCAPRSAVTVATLYGVMRAGAAYVPIDPFSPTPRAARIANGCGIAALVADRERLGRLLPEVPPQVVGLDVDETDTLPSSDATVPAPAIGPEDLGYILYTSGSTGDPKGVMLSHRNARSFVDWAVDELRLSGEDRFSGHAPLHFDLSVFDLYACASVAGTLHLVPERLPRFGASSAAFVQDRALTVWYSVPSALVQWVTQGGVEPGMLASLRHVVFAGEVFPTPSLRRLHGLVPRAALHNWFGPTETNACTAHTIRPEDLSTDDPVPIGRPVDGYPCVVVDDRGEPAETGELLVGGPAVTVGYWGDPDATAASISTDAGGTRWYRTGDLVETGPGGEYRLRGRRDHQVKVRGHRVELGEVEWAISSDERVAEVCVVAVEHDRLGHDLVAFVVAAAGEVLEPVEVKRIVAARLPRAMVPARVTVQDAALPSTSTGKVDRVALETRARG